MSEISTGSTSMNGKSVGAVSRKITVAVVALTMATSLSALCAEDEPPEVSSLDAAYRYLRKKADLPEISGLVDHQALACESFIRRREARKT
jgi:hypothetical protein